MRVFLVFAAILLAGCGTSAEVIDSNNDEAGPVMEIPGAAAENNGIEARVYFCPRDNCSSRLVELISSAEESVHCALFDLDLEEVAEALKNKNAKVVVDNKNKNEINSFAKFDNNNQLSHNKFCIVDSKKVWTGSFNPTHRGDERNNNNAVVYESEYLAKNYEDEFEELWGGVFGEGDKVRNKKIKLNGKMIENYFCPEDGCAARVAELIDSAEESVYFMTFSFTHDLIGNALIKRHNAGVEVKGVFEKSQNNKWNEFRPMSDYGMDVKWDGNSANMHHKVFIIDGEIVVTGSFNPSKNGDERNDENLLVIHDTDVAGKFAEEFENIYIE